ncbi:MAG: hypothetical protein KDA79_05275 [Planctomycetaceae bacterium]|nr:hypothetical protein [Planctomycetaceae bacterium]
MNAAHLHLISVHVPVVGTWIALALVGSAALWRSEILFRAGLGVFLACGLFAGVAYWSGPPAWEQIEQQREISRSLVEDHAVIARAAFLATIVQAVLAGQILFRLLQEEPVGSILRVVFAVGLVIIGSLLVWSAALGGRISHPEVRPTAVGQQLPPRQLLNPSRCSRSHFPARHPAGGCICVRFVQPVPQAESAEIV